MNTRPVRVLFYPFHFWPEAWNGIDEHLLLLARHLDRDHFALLVLAHAGDGPQTARLAERAGLRAVPAPYPAGASAAVRFAALRRLFRAEQVDVLHLHSPAAGGQAVPALAARGAGVRATLATYHQIQPRRLPAKTRAINYLTHACLVDSTLAVSHDVAQSLAAAAGLPRHRLHVVHNGIELAAQDTVAAPLPPRPAGACVLGYFGRLSPEKGLPCLLEALAQLAARESRVQTWIVGDGPERARLAALARQLAIADRVWFLGFRPDARRLMEQVDVVVHVPAYEGFGLVVLEAMAAGRPVVVNDAPGGLREIVVPGETGLVVPAGCPVALAEALARLAAAPAERERLGRNGRTRCAQQFTAARMAARVATHYARALRRHGGGLNCSPTRSQPEFHAAPAMMGATTSSEPGGASG